MSDVSVTHSNPFAGVPKFDTGRLDEISPDLLMQAGIFSKTDRADAIFSGSAMFARQLEYIYTETFDVEYPENKARRLIPVDNRVPNGADYFTYRQFNRGGDKARIVHSFTDDAPMADVNGAEFSQRLFSIASSYGFNIQEMRAAAMAGVPLEAMKASAAKIMIDTKIEDLAAVGSIEVMQPGGTQQAYGLYNAPNVNATTQVSTGTWPAQYAADSSLGKVTSITAMQLDLSTLRQKIFNQTLGEHGQVGTLTCLFSTSLAVFLQSTPRNVQYDATGQTLWEYLQKSCGFKEFDFWNRGDTAGAGSAGRIVAYEKNPRALSLIMSQEFEQFAPQFRNMGIIVPCHARTGCVEVRYPLWMSYLDGPSA